MEESERFTMSKSYFILAMALCFCTVFSSCNDFVAENNFKKELEDDIHYANAASYRIKVDDKENHGNVIKPISGETEKMAIVESMIKKLPKYMIPNIFIQYDQLPLNKNGKIDRGILRKQYEDRRRND